MADDLGWGDVGFNGNETIRTPHLDAMAAAGLRFTRFYSAAPVCSPTRGSALTGRHPYRYGIVGANRGHLPLQELQLASVLRERGYRTGHFGKWHLGTLTRLEKDSNRGGARGVKHYAPPWERGFDACFSTEAKVPTWNPMLHPETGEPYGTAYWTGEETRAERNLEGDDSRIIMDRALPFVREAVRSGRPFFAVVWFHTPHLPVVAGPEHRALYAGLSPEMQHYLGAITAMDEQIGRLRAELRELGVAGSTMLFFCSDNGPEGKADAPGSSGPFRGRKRSLYEGGIRVPAAWEWPERIAPGRVTDRAAVTSDYLPTILEVLDLDPPGDRELDGISLLSLIDETAGQRSRPIGFESGGRLAWIEPRYKLVRPGPAPEGGGPLAGFELYDLEADPAESRDLADELPEIAARMAASLERWRDSCRGDRERGGMDGAQDPP